MLSYVGQMQSALHEEVEEGAACPRKRQSVQSRSKIWR